MSRVKLASLQRGNTKNSNDFRFQIFMKPLLIFVSHNVFPNIIAKHTGPLNRILLKREETSKGDFVSTETIAPAFIFHWLLG